MAIFNVTASDTGVAVTTAAPQRLVALAQPTTTGLTNTDTLRVLAGRALADTGLSVSDAITPGLHVVVLSSIGLQGGAPGAGGLLDNFNRANETPLSGGGNWGHSFTVVQTLNLVSNQVLPNGSPGQMSWVAGGSLADCEVFCTITQLPLGASGVVGVVARQQVGAATGEDAYFAYLTTSGVVVVGFWDGSGFANSFAVYTLSPAAQVGDKIGLQIKGDNNIGTPITLKTWYQSASGGGWRLLGTTLSPFFTLTQGYIGLRIGSATAGAADDFGGGPISTGLSDGIASSHVNGRAITDTGLTVSDSIFRYFPIHDIGMTFSETLHKRVTPKPMVDTGLTLTDSLGKIALTDTGLSVSDSLTKQRVVPRTLTDTGTTLSDSTRKIARKVVTDTGLTFGEVLVARKNGGNVSVTLSTTGLTVTTTLSKSAHLFRAVPGPFAFPDQGASITDGIRRTTTPPIRPTKPHANFTFSTSGLTVAFTDTSTPGSAPIGSWSWHFGDGGTSSATNPNHTYAGNGTYNVTLTVTTIYGHSSVTKPVAVTSTPATAGTHIEAVIF